MNTKFLPGSVIPDSTLGARQVKVVANSGLPDRVGDVLVASGCDLRNYRKNPLSCGNTIRRAPSVTPTFSLRAISFMPLSRSLPRARRKTSTKHAR